MKNNWPTKGKNVELHSSLKLILTVIFIVALLVSNVITWRQIALPFWITMTGAIIIFPITYILSDVFSEVYWYRRSRITCYMWFGCNLIMSLVFIAVINMKAPEYFTNAEAYSTVLWNTWRVLCASLLAYFGLRAISSSLAWETVDTWIFIPLAFIGTMPNNTLLIMIITQIILKVAYEIIILPITIFVTKKTQQHENLLRYEK